MLHPSPVSVGIDVSKDTLAVAIRFPNHEDALVVPNTVHGITALWRALKSCSCPVIMESTGRYHLLSAFLLSEKGYDVRVVNPIQAKRYVAASIRKVKSDRADASALAQMGVTEQRLPPCFASSKREILIRQKVGLLSSLEKQLQALRATFQGNTESHEAPSLPLGKIERRMEKLLEKLQKEKDNLAKEIIALIAEDEERRKVQDLVCTVPDVSLLTGSFLSQFLRKECVSPKQWVAFVGLDVSVRESGTWKGRGRLSKRGNAYLRKRLFSAAWGAAMNHKQFHAYYERLKEEGHAHREALVIIARKILRIAFAVLKNGTLFSPDLCVFS